MKAWFAIACLLVPIASGAQEITSVTVDPRVPLNTPVDVKIGFKPRGDGSTGYCGIEVTFGDGEVRKERGEVKGDNPVFVISKTYAKPGLQSIRVTGKWAWHGGSTMGPCGGDAISAPFNVVDLAAENRERSDKQRLADEQAQQTEALRARVAQLEHDQQVERERAEARARAAAAAAAVKKTEKTEKGASAATATATRPASPSAPASAVSRGVPVF